MKRLFLFILLFILVLPIWAIAGNLVCSPYTPPAILPTTFNLYFDSGGAVASAAIAYPGTTTGQVYLFYDCTGLADGAHTVYATACIGTSCSTNSATYSFTKAKPTIATIAWSGQFLNSQVYATGNSTEPTYFTLSFDGGSPIRSNAASTTGGVWLNYDCSALTDGAHTVVVTTYNVWGSTASSSFAFNKGKPNAPTGLTVLVL